MLPLGILVSALPLLHVGREGDVGLLGVVMRVGLRHPSGSGSRDPRGGAAERDSAPAALTLIVARRDRKYIITVPFNHFCIRFFYTRTTIARIVSFSHMRRSRAQINRLVTVWKVLNKFANKFPLFSPLRKIRTILYASPGCVARVHSLK